MCSVDLKCSWWPRKMTRAELWLSARSPGLKASKLTEEFLASKKESFANLTLHF